MTKPETPVDYYYVILNNSIKPTSGRTRSVGRHGGAVVSAVASQQEGPGFVSGPARAFLCGVCMFSPCLRGVSSGYSGFLPLQKTCTGNAKHNTV